MKKTQDTTSDRRDSLSHSTHSMSDIGYVDQDDEDDYQYERQQSREPLFNEVEAGESTELFDNRRLSWFTASTGDIYVPLMKIIHQDPITVEKFKVLLKPPEFDNDDIMCAVQSFMKSLADYIPSIKYDKTFDTIKAIRKLVSHDDSVRLYGLLTHFCYWNIIYPVAKKVMHDIKMSAPNYNLFDGMDLNHLHEPADRNKLPKALRVSTSKNISNNKVNVPNSSHSHTKKNFHTLDRFFHEEVTAASGTHSELDDHANHVLQTASDHHSDAGYSADLLSLEDSVSSNISLTLQEKENLYVQLETCILSIFRKMGKSKYSLVVGRQALISCCHIVTDEILTTIYPWFALLPDEYDDELEDKDEFGDKRNMTVARLLRLVNQRLRRLLHQSISDLIDPSRAYTSTLLILNFVGSHQYTSKLLAAGKQSRLLASSRSLTKNIRGGSTTLGGKGKYYRTSAAVIALFSDSHSYEARQFLQRGSALYAPIPGSVQPFNLRLRREQEAEKKRKEEEAARKTITWDKLLNLAEKNALTQAPSSRQQIPIHAASAGVAAVSHTPNSHKVIEVSHQNSDLSHQIANLSNSLGLIVDDTRDDSGMEANAPPSRSGSRKKSMIHVREDAMMPMPWKQKPLDFTRLFEEQPEAYYKPVKLFDPQFAPGRKNSPVKKNSAENSAQGSIQHSANNSVGDAPLAVDTFPLITPTNLPQVITSFPFTPPSAMRKLSPDGVKNNTQNSDGFDAFHPKLTKESATSKSTKREADITDYTWPQTPQLILPTPSKWKRNPRGEPEYGQNNNAVSTSSVVSHGAQSHFTQTTSSYLGDAYSVGSESPSLAQNSLAPLPISLRAKSALMSLMVDKSSRTYRSEIQTDRTKLRVALLKGVDMTSDPHTRQQNKIR